MVGYSGGKELNPTYRRIKDHTESVLIEFDPNVLSFEDVLIEWSRMHSPTRKTSTQYRSAVFYLDEDQKESAEEIVAGMRAAAGGNIQCDVEKATRFYRAEEYHQDFLSQRGGR